MGKWHKGSTSSPVEQIQGAIWLIGLGILFLTGWWWPGILFVIGFSAIAQALGEMVFKNELPAQTEAPFSFEPNQADAPAGKEAAPAFGEFLPPPPPLEPFKPQPEPAAAPVRFDGRWLPARCPHCGGPVTPDKVEWKSEGLAGCPYCGSLLKPAG